MRLVVPGLAVLAALLVSSRALPAQSPAFDLEPGDRIEIAAPTLDPRLVPATVTGRGDDWIGFSLGNGQVWTRRLYHVDEIRVRRPVPLGARIRRGAVWGLFVGTSLGGISGPFVARGIDGETPAWTAVGLSAAAGAAAGAGVGALLGALLPRSDWIHYRFRP